MITYSIRGPDHWHCSSFTTRLCGFKIRRRKGRDLRIPTREFYPYLVGNTDHPPFTYSAPMFGKPLRGEKWRSRPHPFIRFRDFNCNLGRWSPAVRGYASDIQDKSATLRHDWKEETHLPLRATPIVAPEILLVKRRSGITSRNLAVSGSDSHVRRVSRFGGMPFMSIPAPCRLGRNR